jgi:predicted ATPase/DNA-binding CsgD family transcriptional regulator
MSARTQWDDHLPAEVTSFVGRGSEMQEIPRLLDRARVVTLTGVGGVGKTRLAVHITRRVQEMFPDGVCFVDLSDVSKDSLVPQALAVRLGLHDDAARSPTAVIQSHLRLRRSLLVIDNCEHVLDGCADLVSAIVSTAEELRVLTTSRQPLGAAGEHIFEVEPFTSPEAGEVRTLEDLVVFDAPRLLIDRAFATSPAFAPSTANLGHIINLCDRLDGIPLAIELAAVRLRALSIEELIVRLDERFSVLSQGSRQAPARQKTLEALLDWSYELCTPQEQTLWARLSLFTGSFSLNAVQAICADEQIPTDGLLDLVTGLVDKSIIVPTERGLSAGRFKLLETMREYGMRKPAGYDTDVDTSRRHRDYYLQLAELSDVNWVRSTGGSGYLAQQEMGNFRQGLNYCASHQGEEEAGLQFAAALWFHWRTTGQITEGREWFDLFLGAAPAPSRTRAKALWSNAWLASLQGDFDAADDMLAEAEVIAKKIDAPEVLTSTVDIRGLGCLLRGSYDEATDMLNVALSGHTSNGDEVARLVTLHRLAQASLGTGDAETAAVLASQCVDACTESGSWLAIHAKWILGISQWRLGYTETALEIEQSVATTSWAHRDRLGLTLASQSIAWICTAIGDHEKAAKLFGAVDRSWHEVGAHFAARGYLSDFQYECKSIVDQALTPEAVEKLHAQGSELSDAELLEELMGTAPSPAPAPDDVLTSREREVARLVTDGLTNASIASRLVLSTRTVDTHVQNIFTKLGVNSRAQIAAWVASHQLGAPS